MQDWKLSCYSISSQWFPYLQMISEIDGVPYAVIGKTGENVEVLMTAEDYKWVTALIFKEPSLGKSRVQVARVMAKGDEVYCTKLSQMVGTNDCFNCWNETQPELPHRGRCIEKHCINMELLKLAINDLNIKRTLKDLKI